MYRQQGGHRETRRACRPPQSGGLSLSVFTPDEIDDIHLATLEVLERSGVWVELDEALDVFADGGCVVNRETRQVRIPPRIVEESIAAAPPTWTLCGRDPANDILLESNRVGFANFGEGLMVVDACSGELRASVKQDLADTARLVDALSDIDCFEVALGCSDAPPRRPRSTTTRPRCSTAPNPPARAHKTATR